MAKINYPPQEWIEKWIDRYCEQHPDERLYADRLDELRQDAECEWWDNEEDHGRPTPFTLTPEQEKISKEMRKGQRSVNAYGKEVKRVRKPNEPKRELIAAIAAGLADYGAEITNPERQVDFTWQGVAYSVTLTAHRPPKTK